MYSVRLLFPLFIIITTLIRIFYSVSHLQTGLLLSFQAHLQCWPLEKGTEDGKDRDELLGADWQCWSFEHVPGSLKSGQSWRREVVVLILYLWFVWNCNVFVYHSAYVWLVCIDVCIKSSNFSALMLYQQSYIKHLTSLGKFFICYYLSS